MPRRAQGAGSLRKRTFKRKDGSSYERWFAVVTVGYEDGKQKQVWGKSRVLKKEAQADLDEMKRERDAGRLSPQAVTVAEYLDYWLQQIEPADDETVRKSRKQIAPKTFQGFKGDVKNHIKPHLGRLKLSELDPVAVSAWQKKLERAKSPFIARSATSTLSSAMTKAVAWRLLSRSPYADGGVPKVHTPEEEADYWEPSEARKFISHAAVKAHPYYVGYYLTLNLGFRLGELRGLRWQDLVHLPDPKTKKPRPHVHVQQQAIDDRLVPTCTARLKTKTSNRLIPVPGSAVKLLETWRLEQAAQRLGRRNWLEGDHILTNRYGGVPTTGHLRDEFYRLCKEAGVRQIKFHGLRHTAGSLWLEAGVPLMRVSRWLGHSSVKTTESIYVHTIREASYGDSIDLDKMLEVA